MRVALKGGRKAVAYPAGVALTITLGSLGLWHHELCSPTGHVRQELVLAYEDRLGARGWLAYSPARFATALSR